MTDTQTQHTPGPWRIFEHLRTDGMRVDGGDGRKWDHSARHIAAGEETLVGCVSANIPLPEVRMGGYPTVQSTATMAANARLIAAAPDLLEACERLLRAYKWQIQGALWITGREWRACEQMFAITGAAEQARAAIAKAKGA